MKQKEFTDLLHKYTIFQATEQEQNAIENFYALLQEKNKNLPISLKKGDKKRIKKAIDTAIWPKKNKTPFFGTKTFYLAATLLVLLGIGLMLSALLNDGLITVSTKKGERREIIMTDGSHIFLNANSSITYASDFNEKRNINLIGEAFFNVSHNHSKPFKVTTGKIETTVLGTSFNINTKNPDNVSVSVNAGQVEVKSKTDPSYKATLIKDQQAVFSREKAPVISKRNGDNLTAWAHDIIFLNNTSLAQTAKILEDWYDVDISFKEESLKTLTISGKFKEETLHNVLTSIALIKNLEIIYNNPKTILIRKKNKV